MAYFSNGTEGMMYRERYCDRCIHGSDCAVWDMHMRFNYDECNNRESMLHILIPRNDAGIGNAQCSMFVPGNQQQLEI